MDLRKEQRRVVQSILGATVFCALMLAGGWLIVPRYIELPVDVAARLAFALRADVFVFFWVLVGVGMIARGRLFSAADIGGSASGPPSPKLAIRVAFLQNTLEQAFLAVGAHLALATLLSGPALALIPVAVVLFGVGRVAFFAGYSRGAGGRAFGFATTVLPTCAGYVLAMVLVALRF
jgi:hypothetical protein